MRIVFGMLAVGWATVASAGAIDDACLGLSRPDDYDEQQQQDFMSNYFALSTTFSPIHGPIPHDPGHGAVGIELNVVPPLGCKRRFVLNYTKTEDTNKTPVIPRLRVSYAFPELGPVHLYGGFAFMPPVTLLGTRNVMLSAEFGAGIPIGTIVQTGLRFHTSVMRTVGDIATKFNEEDNDFLDLYLASTFGFDAMVGFKAGPVTPYLAAGFTDASTFFYIGDDGVVTNNLHPYFGPNFSLGIDALAWSRFRIGGEFYAAPGGFSKPAADIDGSKGFTGYGSIYTGRLRLAVEI